MKLNAILLFTSVILANQVYGAKNIKESADEDGPPCGYRIIKRLENCCAFPEFISTDIFAACHEELKDETPPEEGGMETATTVMAKKAKKAKKTRVRKSRAAAYKVGWGGGRSMGTYRGGRKSQGQAMCVYECVLRNQSLVTSEGEVDVSKMEKRFVDSAPAEWSKIIKNALSTCSSQYKSMKKSLLPAPITSPTGKACKFGPALFMSCFRNNLLMNCEKGSVLSIDKTCKDKIDFLKTCNPFRVRGSSGKGSKYWGAVEVEETTPNPQMDGAQQEMSAAARPSPPKTQAGYAKASPELKSLYNVFG